MITILFLIFQSVYIYLTTPISTIIRAPPVAPLIPYFPQIFGLQDYFPSFPFIDFIIAILIVATVHEFSHGIFARRHKIKIKSTGFAFLKYFPLIFGAFVEQDEKQMNKKKEFKQMVVLSAGVFANLITGILFYFILIGFFSVAFSASGVVFNTYSYSVVNTSNIESINNLSIIDMNYTDILKLEVKDNSSFNGIIAMNRSYLATNQMLESQQNNTGLVILYDNSPAINAKLGSIITEINGVKIKSTEELSSELSKYSPGDEIKVKAIDNQTEKEYVIQLGKNPDNSSKSWLGIGFLINEPKKM